MSFKRSAALSCLAAAFTLSACGGSDEGDASGDTVAEGVDIAAIEARQDNFEAIGDSFKLIRDEMEGGDPDFAAMLEAAQTIRSDAAEIPGFFPEGTGMDSGADTEALATIWEQPEEFAAAHERLALAADGLVAAVEAGDPAGMEPAIGELGGACQNCHDTFRLDDE